MPQVLNYHDAVLYDTDVALFGGCNWLNDNCVNWYFRYLESEVFAGRDELLFMDPAVVSCMLLQCEEDEELIDLGRGIKAGERTHVFIPINDTEELLSSGSHWSLLVYERETGTFKHLDSSNNHNARTARNAAEQFSRLLGKTDMQVVVEDESGVPQQENGYDCGMYTILIAEWIAGEVVGKRQSGQVAPHLSPKYVAEARVQTKALVLQCIQDNGIA
ncbi:unnamed protein product [Choristocarpus tenellus]